MLLALSRFVDAGGGGNLCRIGLYVDEASRFKSDKFFVDDFDSIGGGGGGQHGAPRHTVLTSGTAYRVVCLTNETVRGRNFISLAVGNQHQHDHDSSAALVLLTNRTYQEDNHVDQDGVSVPRVYYMKAPLRLDDDNDAAPQTSLLGNYTLMCRFLTVDPSIYCETSLHFRLVRSTGLGWTSWLGVFVLVMIVSLTLTVATMAARLFIKHSGACCVSRLFLRSSNKSTAAAAAMRSSHSRTSTTTGAGKARQASAAPSRTGSSSNNSSHGASSSSLKRRSDSVGSSSPAATAAAAAAAQLSERDNLKDIVLDIHIEVEDQESSTNTATPPPPPPPPPPPSIVEYQPTSASLSTFLKVERFV